MHVQQTSLEAYRKIRKKLGQKQQDVYDGFLGNGSCTNLEISKLMGIPINSVTPRTNELCKMGKVVQDGKRPCNISGKMAIQWRAR